jgi:hypothetical protein
MWRLKECAGTQRKEEPQMLSEEVVGYILLNFKKWLNINKEVAHKKILRCTNKDQVHNVKL